MTNVNNHVINVYRRRGVLHVSASLAHSKGGDRMLDFVLTVDGWDGLSMALAAAEHRALDALGLPEAERAFDIGAKGLLRAAGCKSYPEFVNGTVACFLVRLDDECVAQVWTPDARAEGFGMKDEEFPADPAAPIETLAPLVRKAIESA